MMLEVARHTDQDDPVGLTIVSKRTDISKDYLEQVELSLRSARLLRGGSPRTARAGRSDRRDHRRPDLRSPDRPLLPGRLR
jgi:hypothetical protein